MKPETPLLSCRAKIEWAETEINKLKIDIEAFFQANPHTISAKIDANGIEVSRLEPPSIPSRFNVFAGKIVASIREPLDQMLTALVEHSGKSSAGIQFPFGETIDRFENQLGALEKKKALPKDAIDLIRALQPHREQGNELLYALHAINKADKHHPRLIPINLNTLVSMQSAAVFSGQLLTFGPRSGRHFVLDRNSNWSQADTAKQPFFDLGSIQGDERILFGCGISPAPLGLTVPIWYNQRGIHPTDVSKIIPLRPGEEDDMELFTSLPGTKFEAEYKPSFSVAFGDVKGLEREPVPAVLNQMRDLVERILLTFERRFFP